MAYSKTKYQLTHLLQDAWNRMGQLRTWKVTGGGTTSVINTAWAGVEDAIFEDDDASLIFGSVVVVEDAGGLGAAPEGEISRITDYDSASQTITMDAITAVAANDRVGIATPLFPYEDMKELANLALRKLGRIDLVDTSISIVAGQSEYTLPIKVKPKRVRIATVQDSNDHRWEVINNWSIIPATAGSFLTLVVPALSVGYSLEVLYEDNHPELTGYASDIMESIEPELALNALLVEAYQWYNNSIGGSNPYMIQRENKALQDFEQSMVKYPIRKIDYQVQGFPHWNKRGEYVPLTSDLRYP
jgi:hypothetical protein